MSALKIDFAAWDKGIHPRQVIAARARIGNLVELQTGTITVEQAKMKERFVELELLSYVSEARAQYMTARRKQALASACVCLAALAAFTFVCMLGGVHVRL